MENEQLNYMGSLPSNTESNPREQLNAITIQDEEGLVEPEPKPRQGIVVSKGKGEVDHNEQKPVSKEYKPRVSYLNATRKDRTDEQFETRSKSTHEPCSRFPEPHGQKHRRAVGRAHTTGGNTAELATPLEKVIHDYHALPDHHDNLFARHCGCETQPLPPPLIIALADYSP
ncbi:hypothetical protein GOBAR_AA11990 [Gossypium barbadense]|uniref:Uncharacterized protein n=1 Tax=Gossypium barbadense TaxID=3634 RepID=A0A2P5XZ89_GOSBA|nr:hypothetical protein GOBAR_AA11990 [Gossypium barbadense]